MDHSYIRQAHYVLRLVPTEYADKNSADGEDHIYQERRDFLKPGDYQAIWHLFFFNQKMVAFT
jgi:hypothetical protein